MKSLFDKLIPQPLKKDLIAYPYARNLLGAALITAIAAPTYAGLYYFLNFPKAALIIILTGFTIIISCLSLRLFHSLFFSRELLLSSFFLCILWLSSVTNGLHSPSCFWLILPPLMAIFFGSLFEAVLWSILCILCIAIFSFLEYQKIPLPPSPITNPILLQTLSLDGLILIILWLVYFYETGKREASREILSMNQKLRFAKEEAEESAQKAETASRLKTEFLANMSHELRTPLNGIIGFTDLIEKGKAGSVNREQREYLNDISISARHLLQLINDILDLAKVESGKIVFHHEPIELPLLCQEVQDALSALIQDKHLHYSCEIDPRLQGIIIDAGKLRQVIYNYLSNAIKFTPEKGRIELRLFPVGIGFFRLEVRDTGIGIQKEDLNKLFVEFQQLDSSFSKKYPGTGLGLALTQRIVCAQGGSVGVESQYGKGSLFFAILPCTPRSMMP